MSTPDETTILAWNQIPTWKRLLAFNQQCINKEDSKTAPHINFDLIRSGDPKETDEIKSRLNTLTRLGILPLYAASDGSVAIFLWNMEHRSEDAFENFIDGLAKDYSYFDIKSEKLCRIGGYDNFLGCEWLRDIEIISKLSAKGTLYSVTTDFEHILPDYQQFLGHVIELAKEYKIDAVTKFSKFVADMG
ncbi:hypothetical protein MGU_09496 [Metarhizium guizhouense ARSEF 977]|uniref:Uncharacterized protein n=1 Tax=Metarhizium guizhouense (strain ARSEF 977) TaxID=1276136 RepID=A0A0B4G927_METGA|nr:hypothetical protein MGU_09496 [Metarhizium guizhouense ARSEF 977]